MGIEASNCGIGARGRWSELAGEAISEYCRLGDGAGNAGAHVHPRAQDLENLLQTLALTWEGAADFLDDGLCVDERFTSRVVSKLKHKLRRSGCPEGDPVAVLAQSVREIDALCRRTLGERHGCYLVRPVPTEAGVGVEDQPDQHEREDSEEAQEARVLYGQYRSMALSEDAALSPLFVWIERDVDNVNRLRRRNGEIDARKLVGTLGYKWDDARRCASYFNGAVRRFRKTLAKMNRFLPRSCRDIYDRVKGLATESLRTLPPAELRRELFDLSRSLFACFDRDVLVGRALQPLSSSHFDDTVDRLLGERKTHEPEQERAILERLMQESVTIREALEEGDINRAFAHIPKVILDAARMQGLDGPARPQILLGYGYLFRLTAQYDECVSVNRAIVASCDAIVRRKGTQVLDAPPEFEHAETLRRVRTKALLNELVVLFYFNYTTAADKHFLVKDYKGVGSLPARMQELLRFDPTAEGVAQELLVVQAHLARAAYNAYRVAKGEADREYWKEERVRQRRDLRAVIRKHFFDADLGYPDSRRLVQGVIDVGEGAATNRTLDILEDVLREQRAKDAVAALRAERKAAVPPTGAR